MATDAGWAVTALHPDDHSDVYCSSVAGCSPPKPLPMPSIWDDEAEAASWQRCYLGYHERFVYDYVMSLCNGKKVTVSQAPAMDTTVVQDNVDPGVTGTTVWDAAIVLAQYLCTPRCAKLYT